MAILVSLAQHGVGLELRGLVWPPPSCPLTLFAASLRPSWNDSSRCHTEVRCWPWMVT